MKIGILTSGGDCPGLNAVIRGFCKFVLNQMDDVELIGITDGYYGLINNETRILKREDFSGILNVGGTILGTSRQPFSLMKNEDRNGVSKLDKMKQTYEELGLDCLVTLGGAGTHKTAGLLSAEGLNVIGIPKTIDNDVYGTEVTFGFHSAVDIATECIDRLHTTAASHGRTMFVELMGNKVGWLTLYAGIAGGADVVLLPEFPYDPKTIAKVIKQREKEGHAFNIIAIAEGAKSIEESKMKKSERIAYRGGQSTSTTALANYIHKKCGVETRIVVPGHLQRGGNPSAYDRLLSSEMGSFAGRLFLEKKFGTTVAIKDNKVTYNKLSDVAGTLKYIPEDNQMINIARGMGIVLGDGKKYQV
jgi:6-phosphofructokinase 1